jgi:hypothetical protein
MICGSEERACGDAFAPTRHFVLGDLPSLQIAAAETCSGCSRSDVLKRFGFLDRY